VDGKLKEFAPFDRWAEELFASKDWVEVSSTVTLPLEINHFAVMYLLIIDLRKTIHYIYSILTRVIKITVTGDGGDYSIPIY